MLEWMQRHKKYLVVIVWISSISLVLATFLGWGESGFAFSSQGKVAKVGNVYISEEEYNNSYRQMIERFSFGGKALSDEEAKLMQLDKYTLDGLIANALVRLYAEDMGLQVQDAQVAEYISSVPEFQTNSVFDPQKYKDFLSSTYRKAKDFEEEIRKQLLYEKMMGMLLFPSTNLELNSILSSSNIEDSLQVSVLNSAKSIKVDEAKLKDYFNANKQNYKSNEIYKIAYIKINPDSITPTEDELKSFYEENKFQYKDKDSKLLDFKQARDLALKDFQVKKAQDIALLAKVYLQNNLPSSFPTSFNLSKALNDASKEDVDLLLSSFTNGSDLLKDSIKVQVSDISQDLDLTKLGLSQDIFEFLSGLDASILDKNQAKASKQKDLKKEVDIQSLPNSVIIYSLLDMQDSKPLGYELARDMVLKDFISSTKKTLLQEMALKRLKDKSFAQDLGLVNLASNTKITGLSEAESKDVLSKIFISTKKDDLIWINDDKVLIYNVKSQKFPSYTDNLDPSIAERFSQAKFGLMMDSFVRYASSKYKIIRYRS